MISTFVRIVKSAFSNIWRMKFVSLAVIIIIALIIFIANIVIFIDSLGKQSIAELNKKVDIIVYIKDDTDFIEVDSLIEELRSFSGVKKVRYTTKEEALEELIREYPDQKNPFKKTGLENALPSSIQILTETPKDQPQILSFLYEGKYSNILKNVNNVSENQTVVRKLITITDWSEKIMYSLLISLLIGGFIIIFNAIFLTINARKDEISIMKLVGAGYTSIKAPFLLEGVIYGCGGVLISLLFMKIFIQSTQISEISAILSNKDIITQFISKEFIAGSAIGFTASLTAVEKFLINEK